MARSKYLPLFEVREAMSHTEVFDRIASVVVRFVCDHDAHDWTMDRHYNYKKCLLGTCRCCFAQSVLNVPLPQNEDACERCADAWRLSTVSRFLRYVAIEHGKAQPRWWIWSPMSLPLSSFVDGGYKPQDGGQPEIEADDTSGAAPPVADEKKEHWGYKPQWKWQQERWAGWSSSSASEWMGQPDVIPHGEPWVHLESEEKSVATDEAAGTAAAISHKNEGTDVHVHVRFAQTTAGAGDEPPEAAGADEKEGTLRQHQ